MGQPECGAAVRDAAVGSRAQRAVTPAQGDTGATEERDPASVLESVLEIFRGFVETQRVYQEIVALGIFLRAGFPTSQQRQLAAQYGDSAVDQIQLRSRLELVPECVGASRLIECHQQDTSRDSEVYESPAFH